MNILPKKRQKAIMPCNLECPYTLFLKGQLTSSTLGGGGVSEKFWPIKIETLTRAAILDIQIPKEKHQSPVA